MIVKDWGFMIAVTPDRLQVGDVIMGVRARPRVWELWDDSEHVTLLRQLEVRGCKWQVASAEGVQFPASYGHQPSVIVKKQGSRHHG